MDLRKSNVLQSIANLIITNGSESEPQRTVLSRVGYPPEKLQELKLLAEDADQKNCASRMVKGEQIGCTQRYTLAFSELKQMYRTHRKRAKVLFDRSPELLVQLGCTGRVGSSCADIVASAELLYGGISFDPAIQKALAVLDLGPVTVALAKDQIANVLSLRVESGKCKAETERAFALKKESHTIARRWIETFYKVARIAFAENQSSLIALGIKL